MGRNQGDAVLGGGLGVVPEFNVRLVQDHQHVSRNPCQEVFQLGRTQHNALGLLGLHRTTAEVLLLTARAMAGRSCRSGAPGWSKPRSCAMQTPSH